MANADRPCGLKPVKYTSGKPWNGAVTMYYSSGATAIYKGMVVVSGSTASADGKTPSVVAVSSSGKGDCIGVAVGFSNQRFIAADVTNLNKLYAPGSSAASYIAVVDDPDVLFEIQEDNGSSAHISIADVGQFFPITNYASGTAATGHSTTELDSDGNTDTEASGLVQLVALVDREDNTIASSADHAKWLVRIGNHQMAPVGLISH